MRRMCRSRANGGRLLLLGLVAAIAAGSANAQERVSIEQVQVNARRSAAAPPATGIQESDYILGAQSGIGLLNPGYLPPSASAASNQARALQLGTGNVANIDQSGYANIAIQSVVGSQNTVTQMQTGGRNQSTISVIGNSNAVGTQQETSGAVAAITVRGDNNAITAQQSGNNPLPIGITQVGNGANVTVARK